MDNFQCLDNECKNNNQNSNECSDGKPIGYYLDLNEDIFKKCFENCKFCYGEGNERNNNCLECKSNFIFLNESSNDNNCYEKCDFYYYFDKEGIYHCTLEEACPNNYNKLIKEKRKCIDECKNDGIYIYEYDNICSNVYIAEKTGLSDDYTLEYEYDIINFEPTLYRCFYDNPITIICSMNDIFNNSEIYKIIINDILPSFSSEIGKSIMIEGYDDIIFQITDDKNEKELLKGDISNDYNLSIIDLAECENILKEEYDIHQNDSIIFVKQEKLASKSSKKIFNMNVSNLIIKQN